MAQRSPGLRASVAATAALVVKWHQVAASDRRGERSGRRPPPAAPQQRAEPSRRHPGAGSSRVKLSSTRHVSTWRFKNNSARIGVQSLTCSAETRSPSVLLGHLRTKDAAVPRGRRLKAGRWGGTQHPAALHAQPELEHRELRAAMRSAASSCCATAASGPLNVWEICQGCCASR